ncbi:MAG: hypothetical protein U0802_10010 [Candidatus Binatia bacterium]
MSSAGLAHVGAGAHAAAQADDAVRRLPGVLDPHHGVGAVRHRRTGHNADGRAGDDRLARPAPRPSRRRRDTGVAAAAVATSALRTA